MFDCLRPTSFLIAALILVVLLLFYALAEEFDKPSLFLLGIFLSVLIFVVPLVWFPEVIYTACDQCGQLPSSGDFCSACGADLVDDCECGHIWKAADVYCIDCGKQRQ